MADELMRREDMETQITPERLMDVMTQMEALMRGMAETVRATNSRMTKLERQIELMTPLTRAQERGLTEAIRRRALELCGQYGLDPGRAREIGAAIRRHLRTEGGVRATRELPRIEYVVLMERVALWDDYEALRAIRRRDREEKKE